MLRAQSALLRARGLVAAGELSIIFKMRSRGLYQARGLVPREIDASSHNVTWA
jgi:hypothetical protein